MVHTPLANTSAWRRKLTYFIVPLLPAESASPGFGGGPGCGVLAPARRLNERQETNRGGCHINRTGGDARAFIEATGRYCEPAAIALHEYGIRVTVIKPLFIKQSGGLTPSSCLKVPFYISHLTGENPEANNPVNHCYCRLSAYGIESGLLLLWSTKSELKRFGFCLALATFAESESR